MISSEKKNVARIVGSNENIQGWEFRASNGSNLGVSPDGQYIVAVENTTPWIWRWLLSPREVVTILHRKSGKIWTISMPEPIKKSSAFDFFLPSFTFYRVNKDGKEKKEGGEEKEQLAVKVRSSGDTTAIFYINEDSPPTLAKEFRMKPIEIKNGQSTINGEIKNGNYSLTPVRIVRINKEQSFIENGYEGTHCQTLFHCKNVETDVIVEIEHAHPVTEHSFREIDGVLHTLTKDVYGLAKLVPVK